MSEHLHIRRNNSSQTNSTPPLNWLQPRPFKAKNTPKKEDSRPISEQIKEGEHFGYNLEKIPTHPPESLTPTPESSTTESEISLKETESPPISSEEASQSQEIVDAESETETLQRQPETSDIQQEEKEEKIR